MDKIFDEMLSLYTHPGVIVGLGVELAIIGLFMLAFQAWRNSSFMVFFEMFFEKVYEFFEDILGAEEKRWTKMYITLLFFIILFSNILGSFLDFFLHIFGKVKEWTDLAIAYPEAIWHPVIEHYIVIPTADINFNVAMAVIWVVIVIYEQFKFLGFWKAIYEYAPIGWKNYIPFERGNLPKYIDVPVFLLVKTFDIIISMFLGVLEIVGHGAKIISLSFRLFGNVTSGGLLMIMLVWAISTLTWGVEWVVWDNGILGFEFPILFPVILHLQVLPVAFIQALVFPLLIAIFIKVAKVH